MGVLIQNTHSTYGLADAEFEQLLHLVELRAGKLGTEHLVLEPGEKTILTSAQTELLATTLRSALEAGELLHDTRLFSIERLDQASAWSLLSVLEDGHVEVRRTKPQPSPIRRFPQAV